MKFASVKGAKHGKENWNLIFVVRSSDLHSLRESTGLLAVAQARRGQVKSFPEVLNFCCEWQEPTPLTRSRCLAWPGLSAGRVGNPGFD